MARPDGHTGSILGAELDLKQGQDGSARDDKGRSELRCDALAGCSLSLSAVLGTSAGRDGYVGSGLAHTARYTEGNNMRRPLTALVLAGSLATATIAPTQAHARWWGRGWGLGLGAFALGAFAAAALARPAYAYGYGYPAYSYGYGYPAYSYGYGYPAYSYGYGYPAYSYGYGYPASYGYAGYGGYYGAAAYRGYASYGGYGVTRRVVIHRARWR
jgi:hypothetical protein